jgi:hypothetical protein
VLGLEAELMRLKSFTYTSRARLDLTQNEVHDIVREARRCNALDGVTGILVFDGSRFLQVLEGAEDAVDSLVERLRRDPRHLAFEVRDERFVEDRSFPSWSMELVRVSAGFMLARDELTTKLPASVSPSVRNLAMQMSDELDATR